MNRSERDALLSGLADAERELSAADQERDLLGGWLEYGCGVVHDSFDEEEACAECAASHERRWELNQLEDDLAKTISGLKARLADLGDRGPRVAA